MRFKPCDARCMNSMSHICECSCGGRNHGIGNVPIDPERPHWNPTLGRSVSSRTSDDANQLTLILQEA